MQITLKIDENIWNDSKPTKNSEPLKDSEPTKSLKHYDIICPEEKIFDEDTPVTWYRKHDYVKKFKINLSRSVEYQGKFSYEFSGFDDWETACQIVRTRKYIYEDFLVAKPYLDFDRYHRYSDYIKNKK